LKKQKQYCNKNKKEKNKMTNQQKEQAQNFTTPEMRVRYVSLADTAKVQGEETNQFGLTAFFNRANFDLYKPMLEFIQNEMSKYNKPWKNPDQWGNGTDKVEQWGEIMENTHWFRFKRNAAIKRPIIFDQRKRSIVEPDEIKNLVYPGCWIRVNFEFNHYQNKTWGWFYSLQLNAVQKVRDDESLGSSYSLDEIINSFDEIDDDEGSDESSGDGLSSFFMK
jgi:hypothetical protein